MALFLAYLAKETAEERFGKLSQQALATAQRLVTERKADLVTLGAFNGWGGVIYALCHLGRLWNRPELFAEAEQLVSTVSELVLKDEAFDIVAGSGSAIAGLLCLHRVKPSPQVLETSVRCGDWLIEHAQATPSGLAWVSATPRNPPLLGFSHGVAGIAWALLKLAAATGEERFRTSALEALAYERSLFSVEMGNWPDLRQRDDAAAGADADQPAFMSAWCHGAPGIGLARLNTLRQMDDAATRAEIHAALETTCRQGLSGNHSLCHGDLGNLELLLEAGRGLEDPRWQSASRRLAGRVAADIRQHGWLCGVPHQIETPGLMTGLAGIGYEFLRLTAPDRVPSVLTLDPPVAGERRRVPRVASAPPRR